MAQAVVRNLVLCWENYSLAQPLVSIKEVMILLCFVIWMCGWQLLVDSVAELQGEFYYSSLMAAAALVSFDTQLHNCV